MEDNYRKSFSKSSERTINPDDIDPLCLYIRQIPSEMSQDDFFAYISCNGRRVPKHMNLVRKPHMKYSFGFAHFATHAEALNALNEINGRPPLHLSVIFANKNKKNENENKVPSISENMPSFKGRGRGQRISLDSPASRIKIIAGDDGRKVTVDSFSENSKSDDGKFPKDSDSVSKVPNPFYFCFVCGQEGMYSCKHCRKPYCSKNCQMLDFTNHKELCKRAKELAETLLCLYKNFPVQSCDSGMSESSNSEPEKLDPVVETKPEVIHKPQQVLKAVENLVLSPGEVEIVKVIKIESPSKFSVRLKKYSQDFSSLEQQLTSQKQNLKQFHNQLCVSPQLDCCALYNEKMCRTKVLQVKSQNEILVDLLDYGKVVTVQKCALWELPSEFRNLPAQAIPCRLVSDENEIIQWNEEDTLSFELHTNNKTYKAHVFSCSNGVYDVALINDDGIPLHSILIEEKKSVCNGSASSSQTKGKPPSIWTKLQPNAKVFLIPNVTSGNFIWCYLTAGKSDLNEIMEIEKLLQNYSGRDISRTVVEDDFAAGFSKEYNQYYRCRILKRKADSFLVHYIDYGNEEEITQLSCLSDELLQKCCYLVKCEKPSELSIAEFQKCLGQSDVDVSVLRCDKNKTVLSFHYKQQYSITCYPCYSNFASENEACNEEFSPVISKLRSPSNSRDMPRNANDYNSVSEINVTPNCKPKEKNINDYKIIAEKITVPKVLLPSTNYNVKIVFIKTASELYVHLKEDEMKMNAMVKSLNSFCNSENGTYVPNIGEIVSCKFSDGVWYRGQVLEKMNNTYRVFFVDYGNEDIVRQNDIQILSDRFICPQFSICISLSGIKNEDISNNLLSKLLTDDWDMKVIDPDKVPVEVMLYQKNIPITKMIEIKTDKVKSKLKFQTLPTKSSVKICFEDDKYLYVNPIKDIKSLEEMSSKLNNSSDLQTPKNPKINNVYAGLFSDGLFYRVSIEETLSPDSFKVYFLDFGNYEVVSTSNLRELPNDIFALPVYCIPFEAQDRKNLTLNMEDEYTVEVTGMKDGVATVKFLGLDKSSDVAIENVVKPSETKIDANDKSFLTFKKLPEVGVVDVKVCYTDDELVYVHQVSDLQVVEDLLIKVNSSSNLLPVVQPIVNKVYCGLSSDGYWYRVSVEEITSNNAYKVYFLDFGNYETLSVDKLRELPKDFFPIPVCCVPVAVEKSEKPTFNLEEQYKVQVIGKQNNVQVVKRHIDNNKDNSVNIVDAGKNHLESSKSDVTVEEKENLPNISSFKKQKLQDGLNEVVFCHLEGNIVYCQLSSDDDIVLSMFKMLQKCGNEGKAPGSLSVGDVICAQSSDTLWYRACIISDKNAPSYKVLFFDYGNTESVTKDCIKILSNDLLDYPIFAIPMQIQNADNITDNTVYTKPMLVKKIKEISGDTYVVELQLENASRPKISSLKKLTLPDDLISNVTICHIDDSLYYIQPSSNMNNLNKLVTKLLEADTFANVPHTLEEGDIICAKYIDGLWYRCAVKKVLSDKIEVYFIDYGNSDSVSVNNVKIMPLELAPYAIASIPVKFKHEDNLRSKLSQNVFTINVKVCGTTDNIQVVDIVSYLNSSDEPETEHVAKVSYIPTFLSSFTKSLLSLKESHKVQIKTNVGDLYVAIKHNDRAEIEKLNLVLRECETDTIDHLPSVNEVLLAKKDNVLYRCAVLDFVAEKDMYEMYFVDLGVTENVPKTALRTLPDNCKTFPLFAIKVSIESEQPVSLDKSYNISVLNQKPEGTYHIKVYHQYNYSLISRKELTPMKKTDVIFCHREGEKLFLQEVASVEMLNEVQTVLSSLTGSGMPYKPDAGELVCAMSKLDNAWYRGCIEEVLSNDEFKVLFIDYGNFETIPIKNLQPMPFNLTKFPKLCIPVKFANAELMQRIDEQIYEVQADAKAANDVQIIKLVESNEVAVTTEPKTSSENLKKNDTTKKFFFKSCKYVPFKSGEQDIVIYSVDEEGYVYCAPYNLENIQANLSLPGLITEHCMVNGIPYDDCEPDVGEMVLALYSADNNWYRAVVIQKSHPEYDVSFVDYGNIESINIKSLRKMEEKFMELDIQAHICSLTGFTYPSENLDKVCSVLKKFEVLSDPLTANVKIINGDITVNIPTITSQLLQEKLVTLVDEK